MSFVCKYCNKSDHTLVIEAPDGVAYSITILGWYWNVLDYLEFEGYEFSRSDIYAMAWRIAQRCLDAETFHADGTTHGEYRYFIMYLAQELFEIYDGEQRGYANDEQPKVLELSDSK